MLSPEDIARDSESSQQAALFQQAALHLYKYPMLKWLHAIPNANSHKMVAEGVRGGVPDVCLPWPKWISGIPSEDNPSGRYLIKCAGLYIEMKLEKYRNRKNGGCSDDQIKWIDYLLSVGYQCYVCYSWQEAWQRIEEYLNG